MKHLIAIFFVILLMTCTNNTKQELSENQNVHVIDIENIDHSNNLKLSELFKDVTPIILETTQESLIGHINKIVITSDHIIILDNMISNAIFIFDKNGLFLRKLGRLGTGPGEYTSISDFCCDMLHNVYVLDFQSQKINQYELKTGEFKKTIPLDRENGMSWFVEVFDNELYTNLGFFNKEEAREILIHRNKKTGKIIDSWFDVDRYSLNIDFISNNNKSPFLCKNDSSFKFKSFFMDSIMAFENNRIIPFLTFTPKFKLDNVDVSNIDFDNSDFFSSLSRKNKIFDVFTYIEHEDLIIIQFFLGLDARTIIYNQKEQETISVNFFIDDLIYNEIENRQSYPNFLTFDQNGVYAWLNYDNINELKNNLEKGVASSEFDKRKMISSLDDDSNPILLYYEFKD